MGYIEFDYLLVYLGRDVLLFDLRLKGDFRFRDKDWREDLFSIEVKSF